MVKLKIDNIDVEVEKGTTILDAAKSFKIQIPSLCYLKDINEIGACRVCIVEVKGKDKLLPACNNVVEDGMEIFTNSPRVRETRRTNIKLILSQHDCHCATCVRSGNCNLQNIANDLGVITIQYKRMIEPYLWDERFPLIRDARKCIKCMRCIQVCNKIQSLNIWDVSNTGTRTTVDVSLNRKIQDSDCSLCGQCITHCPTGALRERDNTQKAFDVLSNKDKITVLQIAPAVRASWGESLGLTKEKATVKRLVSALRKIGFDYIFDTNFAADLTIMEEGSEFLEILQNNTNLPIFTSCCPAWVRFLKSQYPDMTKMLSTAKSPQQMFGAIAKSYYAKLLNVDPSKIYCISIMPCIAKKHEAEIPIMNDAGYGQDIDLCLTTREVERMIRSEHIIANDLNESDFDTPLGIGSGAGVIFGSTGGVMEAALRTAYFLTCGNNPDPNAFKEIRGMNGIKEASFEINNTKLKVAVVSGLNNARNLIKNLRKGNVYYDFIEVMACPGGCSGGGGQPIKDGIELAETRSKMLYELDELSDIRFSHENPSILNVYKEFLEKPLSNVSHKLLHTDHNLWEMPLSPGLDIDDK
ncbi:2Fe-2S iron-sulfur cluster binding domain-containing protein [Clostridium botulinum]|nr:2Fe-2S iron-sulfur cluster binding domain-containing protein [Clostridium botulinum]NFN18282.1 2Fe-2S iron-sulfur cluster binding domain-containing protein [Clostridium botulinum]NFN49851.1 2Fe-2S iron-sulfur cluster binding domain-containing protein [Clostridium botulinum]